MRVEARPGRVLARDGALEQFARAQDVVAPGPVPEVESGLRQVVGVELVGACRGGDARYLLAVDAIISADPGAKVKAGDVIARIPTEGAKTRDITGGLPRVAELFEARRPKDAAEIAKIDGLVDFGQLAQAVVHAGVHAGDQLQLRLAVVGGDVRVRQGRPQRQRVRGQGQLAIAIDAQAFAFDAMQASYFLGREVLVPGMEPKLSWWRRWLFLTMARNAVPATEFFRIPSDRVVELGTQLEI